jgi:hypothetical protein
MRRGERGHRDQRAEERKRDAALCDGDAQERGDEAEREACGEPSRLPAP